MTRFSERTVLITGASRGLGAAIARGFAREGAHVYLGYRQSERDAHALAQAIAETGGRAQPLGFDVTDASSVERAFERVFAERGALDVLVNCAGVVRDALFPLMDADDFKQPIEVTLTGAFHCCRAAVRRMLARRAGAIVNVGSVAGIHASRGQSGYAAAKAGLLAFTRTLAAELGPAGLRVNAVVPGLLSTGMATRLDQRTLREKQDRIALRRLGSGEEVAEVVLFLASDQASYIVGQGIVVDGGLTL